VLKSTAYAAIRSRSTAAYSHVGHRLRNAVYSCGAFAEGALYMTNGLVAAAGRRRVLLDSYTNAAECSQRHGISKAPTHT